MDKDLEKALNDLTEEMGITSLSDILKNPERYIYSPEEGEELER